METGRALTFRLTAKAKERSQELDKQYRDNTKKKFKKKSGMTAAININGDTSIGTSPIEMSVLIYRRF